MESWLNSIPKWIVKPSQKIINRHQRRKYDKSYYKILDDLLGIEEMFLSDICFSNCRLTYNDLYLFHLDQFRKSVLWHQRFANHENVIINESYFRDKFKPIIT